MGTLESVTDIMPTKLLVIDDDPKLTELLEEAGNSLGFEVKVSREGSRGLQEALAGNFDLVVIDVNLPGLNGFEVCRLLRAHSSVVSILMLTSRAEEIDRVLGLELGADDYVTKPFSIREVSARMRVLARRAAQLKSLPSTGEAEVWQFHELKIIPERRECFKNGQLVNLTAVEFEILQYLASRAGKAVSRDVLMQEVWGYECTQFDSTITTHLSRLRGKIETNPEKPKFVLTVKGIGYRFVGRDELAD